MFNWQNLTDKEITDFKLLRIRIWGRESPLLDGSNCFDVYDVFGHTAIHQKYLLDIYNKVVQNLMKK